MKGSFKLLLAILFLFNFVSPEIILAGNVVVNEFQVNPYNKQWPELYNKGTDTIDFSGFLIDDNEI